MKKPEKKSSRNKKAPPLKVRSGFLNFKKILEVNRKINSTLCLNELLSILMNTAAEVMHTEAASLMLIDESSRDLVFRIALGEKGRELAEKFRVRLGEGIAGRVAQTGKPLIVNQTTGDKRFAKRFDTATGFQSKAILCVPLKSKGKIIGILEAINPLKRSEFTEDDLFLFETFADLAAIAIDNAKLHAELVKQEKAHQELAIARSIQQNFLPDPGKLASKIDIAAKNIPALEVGGDFYDFIPLDENRLAILIGDVSGKGVPAALYMVRVISEYRSLCRNNDSPAALVHGLNQSLTQETTMGMFITLICLSIDLKNRTLKICSAGHHPALKREGTTGEIFDVAPDSGLPVGLAADSIYMEITSGFQAGDIFSLYTDGITEARNQAGKEFSLDGLKKCFAHFRPHAKDYNELVFEELDAFTQNAPQHDDMTLITIAVPRGNSK